MQAAWTIGVSPWILGLSLLSLLGLFILLRGLYPQRVGTTLYCRKCNYNLTGTERDANDARCPECGASLASAEAIVIGERIRRWRRVLIGVFLCLLGAVPLVTIGIGAARGVDWNRHKPSDWLIWNLDSASSPVVQQALNEIRRRHASGSLTERQVHALIDACLREQAEFTRERSAACEMVDLLGEPTIESTMTLDQKQRYANNLMQDLTLTVPPRLEAGKEFLINFSFEGRIPRNRLCPLRVVSLKCNESELWSETLLGGSSGCGRVANSRPVRLDQPGHRTFEAIVVAELHADYGFVEGRGQAVLASKPITLLASTEVFANDDPDAQPIRSVEREESGNSPTSSPASRDRDNGGEP